VTWIWAVFVLGVVLALAIKWVLAAPRPVERPPFRIPEPDPDVFMLRGYDFYVRLDASRRHTMLEAVRNAVGTNGTVYDQKTHAVVLWHDFQPPEPLLARLSKDLKTQVIWLAFQKQVDAFGYARWENGARLRRLAFGCYEKERTWEQVDGEPEPWEASALFDKDRLERRLSAQHRLGGELAPTAEEEDMLREVWRERCLIVESVEPSINGLDVARAVALEHGLPGWS
jgi:hypothetical protein